MLIDNSKSEEFDVYPYRFWNLCDRVKEDAKKVELQNIGAEYFHFMMNYYFPSFDMENYDVKSVVEILQNIENDAAMLFDPTASIEMKIKYKFYPIETF